jgi:ATP-dependent DNA ligase
MGRSREARNEKRSSRAAIAFTYGHDVAYAYPPSRVHRAVPPNQTDKLPSGGQWLHEIKHDGFRIIARKTGAQVRLYSRPGNDFTRRFPLIVDALSRLRSRSCIIDGEAIACDHNGVASFDFIRHQRAPTRAYSSTPPT